MFDKNLYKEILTLQTYADAKREKQPIIHLEINNQEIVFFGAEHSHDPEGEEYPRIKMLFKLFVRDHQNNQIVVFIENFIPPKLFKAPEEMIRSFGESGFVYYLAKKSGVTVICPEPKPAEMLKIASLAAKNKIGVAAWALLSVINWMLIKNNPLTREDIKIIKDTLVSLNKNLKITKKTNIENIFMILSSKINLLAKRKVLPSKINDLLSVKLNPKLIKRLQDPFIRWTKINDAGTEVNRARDYFIARAIIKKIKTGKSVFAVFGKNHVVCENTAITKVFKKAR